MVKKIFETRFENGSLIDAIENRILTPTGTVTLKRTDKGTAALFDGGISSSTARLESDFQITTIPFTVIVNFKLKGFSVGYIISQTMTNDPGRFVIDIQSDGKLEYFLGGNSFKTDTLVNDKWYQAIFTRDGDGVCRFYLDNEYLGTYTNNNAIPLNNLFHIGGSSVVINRVMFGYINKVIVYDGVISTVQREKHYQEFLQSQITEKPVRGFELVKPTDLSYLKDTGLVAAYNMIPNGNTLVDISGNGNNGTILSGNSTKDGMSQNVGAGIAIRDGALITTLDYTICGRVKINNLMASDGVLFSNDNNSSNTIIDSLGFKSGKLAWNYDAAGTFKNETTNSFVLGVWSDFVFISNGGRTGTIKVYIDGIEQTITTTGFYRSGNDVRIFNRANSDVPFIGECSDLRIYTRAFTEAEVKAYHNSWVKPEIIEDWSGSAVSDVI